MLALLTAACAAPPPDPTPTAEPTATAVPTEPAAPTATAVPTDTAVPTPTSTMTPTSPPAATPTPAPERVVVVADGSAGVNLRREPSTNAPVVRSVRDGTIVTLIGPDREADNRIWRNVRDGDAEGWVVATAVRPIATPTASVRPTPEQTATPPPPTPVPTHTATATAPGIPDATAAPAPGSPGASGTPGPTPTVGPEMEDDPEPERVEVTGTGSQGANLRAQPGLTGSVLQSVPDGSRLTVIGEDREVNGVTWRNVRTEGGTTGWLASEVIRSLLTPTPTPRPNAPGVGAPVEGEAEPEEEMSDEERAAIPCRAGQVKGDAASGLFFTPDRPEYPDLRERIRCFDDAARARASGFRPPEVTPTPAPSPEP